MCVCPNPLSTVRECIAHANITARFYSGLGPVFSPVLVLACSFVLCNLTIYTLLCVYLLVKSSCAFIHFCQDMLLFSGSLGSFLFIDHGLYLYNNICNAIMTSSTHDKDTETSDALVWSCETLPAVAFT